LVQLQEGLAQIAATGTQVIGISYDSVEILKKFSDSAGITFPLLSDEGSRTIRAYGIYHRDGIPYPGICVLDGKGVIREKLFIDGYKKRPENADLIEAAKRIK
jgi:peroxiredoxin